MRKSLLPGPGWTVVPLIVTLALLGCSDQGKTIADEEQELEELKEQLAAKEEALAQRREQLSQESSPPESTPPPTPQVRSITLAEGTPIVVRTTTAISTKVVSTGESFAASLEEPLMQGNTQVAPKGASVTGIVAHSDKGGRVKGRASLEVRLQSFVDEDGRVVEVSTNTVGMTAKKTTKKDALKVGIASGVGAAIGAIAGGGKGAAIGAGAGAGAGTGAVLLTRGEAAVLPAESVLRFELRAPVTIEQ